MSLLIETLQRIDTDLASSVAVEIEPVLLLEEIESGSIKTWLRVFLKALPDQALREGDWKKLVGAYLLLGKYRILEFLGEEDELNDPKRVESLRADLAQLAADTSVRRIPSYAPIPARRLVSDLEQMSNSLAPLATSDHVSLVTAERAIEMNKSFTVSPEFVDAVLAQEELVSTASLILKVKKPDYLGHSAWQFRHGGHVFAASVLDETWLESFQNREVTVSPGDSIRAEVRTRATYDSEHELIATRYEVLRVRETISAPYAIQTDLLGDDDADESNR